MLKPGVVLDAVILKHLRRLGIIQLWIKHDLTADLDRAAATGLTGPRMTMVRQIRRDFSKLSDQALTATDIQRYRQTMMDMLCQLISNGEFASIADQFFTSAGDLFTHCANVSYLSMLVGLELEAYIIAERPRLSRNHARDLVPLGLAGMLHDIGKAAMSKRLKHHHEANSGGLDDAEAQDYAEHPRRGYDMVRGSRIPAPAAHAILNHHRRFDGNGWPDTTPKHKQLAHPGAGGPRSGHDIHIFTRIVSAANVLDNLLTSCEGHRRPPVMALHAFMGSGFDGWFDPAVRKALVRRIPPFAVGTRVRLNNGRSAVVISPNLKQPCRPTVRLLDKNANDAAGAETLDLGVRRDLHVAEYLGVNIEPWLFELPEPSAQTAPTAKAA